MCRGRDGVRFSEKLNIYQGVPGFVGKGEGARVTMSNQDYASITVYHKVH